MLKCENAHGLLFTCDKPEAVGALDGTLRAYLAFERHTGAEMKATLALDPAMPMARLVRGNFLMLMGVGALVEKARNEAEAVTRNVSMLEPREAMHAEALAAWAGGSLRKATAIWHAILIEWPRDILAIKLANFGSFYQGQSRLVRDGPASVIDYWDPGEPEYSYLLSLYAFGLEECGAFEMAERLGRQAISMNPRDPWGVHAVAHVLEGTERASDGIDWIANLESHWSASNNFRYHLAWHLALFHFERDDFAGALDVYDRLVYSENATEYLDVCNDASMLARLEIAGIDVGTRWNGVAQKVSNRGLDLVMAFSDVHFVLALASSGERRHRSIAEALCAQMEDFARRAACDDADAYRLAGAALGRALLHFRDGRYAEAARLLMDAEPQLAIIGGSNAQRDLFRELTAESLWRETPDGSATACYLSRRTFHRPHDERNWKRYLEAIARGGDAKVLKSAKRRHATAKEARR